MYYAGDILFYTKLAGSIYDEAIVRVTNSPFVHVAIAINDLQKIEALSGGVMLNSIGVTRQALSWSYINEITSYDREELHNALNWLIMQKGNAYSWGDAANILLNDMHIPVEIATNNLLFCSGLAVEFLMKAGKVSSLQNVIDPHKVTPALLASYLGVKLERSI